MGDYGKKPSEHDFRAEHEHYESPWDLGPFLTLFLAIFFTCLLAKVNHPFLLYPVAGLAFANSLLRLLPMLNSYSSFLLTGNLIIEDEIVMGILWYKRSGLLFLKYLPSMISFAVSAICLKNVIRLLNRKLPNLMAAGWWFAVTSLGAFLALVKVIPFLDEHFRINWLR